MKQLEKAHPDFLDHDETRDTITKLLTKKVGPPYSRDRLSEIYKDGKRRYEENIPPGCSDRDKKEPRQYGDLVLWFQVIDKAKETSKPIILVTDDRKDDWWLKFGGKTIGPRPELVDELFAEAKVSFYMYSADPFMEHAAKYLKRSVKPAAISEVRKIREREEGLLAGLSGYAQLRNLYTPPLQEFFEEQARRAKELHDLGGPTDSTEQQ